MCGLTYMHTTHPQDHTLNKRVWRRYWAQKSRGRQGFGFYANGRIVKSATEARIKRQLYKTQSQAILFHHRYPTSTGNTKVMAHPFTTGDYFGNVQYVFVHNGVLRNYEEFEDKHRELGIEYQRDQHDKFNDSEALMWEFALWHQGRKDEIEINGDGAIIVIERRRKTKRSKWVDHTLHFGRNNGRPLVMEQTQYHLYLASEGKGTPVPVDTLHSYNYATGAMTVNLEFKIRQFKAYVAPLLTSYAKSSNAWGYSGQTKTYNHSYNAWDDDDELTMDYVSGTRISPDGNAIYNADGSYEIWDETSDDYIYHPAPKYSNRDADKLEKDADNRFWDALIETDGEFETALQELNIAIGEVKADNPKAYEMSVLQYAKNKLINNTAYLQGCMFHPYWEEAITL